MFELDAAGRITAWREYLDAATVSKHGRWRRAGDTRIPDRWFA